ATSPAQGSQSASRAGWVRYSRRFSMDWPLHVQQRGVLDVAGEHLHELRIQPRTPDGQRVAGQPQREARQPQLQAQPDHGGDGPVEDGYAAWRTAQQDGFAERTVQGQF